MGAFDYSAVRATARAILAEFGGELVLTRGQDGGTYDPETGSMSGGATLELEGVGVLVPFNSRELINSTIKITDKKLIFSGDALQVGDMLGQWRAVTINDIDPDGSGSVVTIAQMRR